MTDIAFLLVTWFTMFTVEPKVPYKMPSVLKITPMVAYNELYNGPNKLYTLSDGELSALSLKQKAKLVGISKKSFKMMASVVDHESGPKMQDKVMVAAVIINRVHCKQFRNTVQKVINEPGQFYDLKKDHSGSYKDKKAQLAVLIAYREIARGNIPHNVLYFNGISFYTKNRSRYKKYKHYNNYFIKDTGCKCAWCKS